MVLVYSHLKKITVIDDKHLHSTKLGQFLTLLSRQLFNCSTLITDVRNQIPMVSMEFFIDIILPAALWPWG